MKKLLPLVCVLLAILSVIVAIIYFSKTAGALPHFFPGYTKGYDKKHIKHGLAFAGLAIVLLLGAWMIGGKKPEKNDPEKTETE